MFHIHMFLHGSYAIGFVVWGKNELLGTRGTLLALVLIMIFLF
jgi:hypothetical protein